MFNVGGPELLVIFLVALIVLGPSKLPDAARQMGKAMNEFRRMSSGFKSELRDALNEPMDSTPQNPPGSGQVGPAAVPAEQQLGTSSETPGITSDLASSPPPAGPTGPTGPTGTDGESGAS